MLYLIVKAVVSGVLIAVASEVARRWPGWGTLIVSLPLVSILCDAVAVARSRRNRCGSPRM